MVNLEMLQIGYDTVKLRKITGP